MSDTWWDTLWEVRKLQLDVRSKLDDIQAMTLTVKRQPWRWRRNKRIMAEAQRMIDETWEVQRKVSLYLDLLGR